MKSAERVTWLLPVKNGMPFLPETLASIEAQTYSDFEVLAWDNGSSDGSVEELRRWIPSRLPGKVVADNPLSFGESLARMVTVTPTELCARIDADDVNHPDRLTRQVATLRDRPAVGIVGSQVVFIDEASHPLEGAWVLPTSDAEVRWRLRWVNSVNHPAVLFRRSAILRAGNYRPSPPTVQVPAGYLEDYDLWIRAALVTEIVNLPEPLVKYRIRESSITGQHGREAGAGFDRAAELHQDVLFADLAGSKALRLRQLAKLDSSDRVALGDIRALRRAAAATAIAIGKPDSYFRETEYFRVQQRELLRRWLEQQWWGRAGLTLKRRAGRKGTAAGRP